MSTFHESAALRLSPPQEPLREDGGQNGCSGDTRQTVLPESLRRSNPLASQTRHECCNRLETPMLVEMWRQTQSRQSSHESLECAPASTQPKEWVLVTRA